MINVSWVELERVQKDTQTNLFIPSMTSEKTALMHVLLTYLLPCNYKAVAIKSAIRK